MRLLALSALFAFPLAASAHGMFAEAKPQPDGTVRVEVFYDRDDPAADATVRVFNAANEEVLKGTTDAAGVWTFPAPPPGDYTVRAKTDDGHAAKGKFTIVPADVPAPPPDETPTREQLTGPMRWVWVGAGVAGIAVAFGGYYLFARWREKRK